MVRFAVLGCGRIGQMHARNIALNKKASLISVFDTHRPSAEKAAQLNGCRVAEEVEQILRDREIDAVLISTPTPTHADLIGLFAKAGKAVLCEKPIDLNLKRVEQLREQLAGILAPVQIGFNRRFDPGHRTARNAAHNGDIGKLVQVLITSRDPALPPRSYMTAAGGLLRDMTIHDFDLARYMLPEEPMEVFATGAALVDPTLAGDLNEIDTAMITLTTESGVMCQINNTRCAVYGYDQRVELVGTGGMLVSNNQRAHEVMRFGPGITEAREANLEFFIERYTEAFDNQITSFIEAINSGIAPEVGFEDGRRALVLAEAAYRSLETGRKVHVSEIANY